MRQHVYETERKGEESGKSEERAVRAHSSSGRFVSGVVVLSGGTIACGWGSLLTHDSDCSLRYAVYCTEPRRHSERGAMAMVSLGGSQTHAENRRDEEEGTYDL